MEYKKAGKNGIGLMLVTLFLITFSSLLVYLISQQTLRIGANAMPMQLAVETELKLDTGQPVSEILPGSTVDLIADYSPFVMIYDVNKKLIASSGRLGVENPKYPIGVLNYIDKAESSKVTWQTSEGLRFASVALKTKNGYVVAAQSLRQTEELIGLVGELVLLAWFTGVGFSLVVFGIYTVSSKRRG